MCSNNRDKNATEVADIFRTHIDSYREQYKLSAEQWKVINAICNCRTSALGGHVQKCDCCGVLIISYDSCRNRHCPKCQSMAKAKWLEARKSELLPVEYFHTVFTIPHELNVIAGYNPRIIYNILFKAAWEAVSKLGKDKRRLGGEMGMLATLHTWSQSLLQHIHLHCIIPGGALNEEGDWVPCKPGFLFPVKALSRIFRGTFASLLRKAYENNELVLKGAIAHLANENVFTDLLNQLMAKEWCVYSKKPFDGANSALEYLGRYTYKIAISNNRILGCDNGKVKFKWRDYADNNKIKIMTLDAHEFIRRFLTHVLPNGFMRIRTFGFWANSCKGKKLQKILNALSHAKMENPADQTESAVEFIQRLTGIDVTCCPKCKVGKLHNISVLPNFKRRRNSYWDTS
jgi:hypothetical protein